MSSLFRCYKGFIKASDSQTHQFLSDSPIKHFLDSKTINLTPTEMSRFRTYDQLMLLGLLGNPYST